MMVTFLTQREESGIQKREERREGEEREVHMEATWQGNKVHVAGDSDRTVVELCPKEELQEGPEHCAVRRERSVGDQVDQMRHGPRCASLQIQRVHCEITCGNAHYMNHDAENAINTQRCEKEREMMRGNQQNGIFLPCLTLPLTSSMVAWMEASLADTVCPALFLILANAVSALTTSAQFKYVKLLSVCCVVKD